MKVVYKILAAILVLATASCSTQRQLTDNKVSGYDDVVKSNGEGLAFESFEVLALETRPECMVYNASKADFTLPDRVLIQSENGILAFDRRTGKYLCSYGKKGNGNGEYNRISTFFINKDKQEVCIVDGRKCAILSFDLSGSYKGQKSYERKAIELMQNAELWKEGLCVVSNYIYNSDNALYGLLNTVNQSATPIWNVDFQTDNAMESVGKHPFVIHAGQVKCINPFDNVIYTIEGDKLKPAFMVDTESNVIVEDWLPSTTDFNINTYVKAMANEEFVGFTDIFETDKHILLLFSDMSYFLINKANHAGSLYGTPVKDDYVENVPLHGVISNTADAFVGIMCYEDVAKWKFSNDSNDADYKKLRTQIQGMHEGSNAVLLFYKIK